MHFANKMTGGAALGAAMLLGLSAAPAEAAYIVTLTQQGSNVVASGSGSIDLADLTFTGPVSLGGLMQPGLGIIATGPTVFTSGDGYTGFTGPTSFGSGGQSLASSGSGDPVGIADVISVLVVPSGYKSGDPLLDTSTYDGATFASLGVTPGTYVWTWGSGANADSFTLQIGPAAIPEPSSLALLALPLGLLLPLAARRRSRAARLA